MTGLNELLGADVAAPSAVAGSSAGTADGAGNTPPVSIITLRFRDGIETYHAPCVIVGGSVSGPITAWLASVARDGASASTLDQYAQGIRRFAQYYLYSRDLIKDTEEFIRGFSRALDAGNSDLGWEALEYKVASRYFGAFCNFFDWLVSQKTYSDFEHPNPIVSRHMTQAERWAEEARSRKHDMLHHLYPLTRRANGIKDLRL